VNEPGGLPHSTTYGFHMVVSRQKEDIASQQHSASALQAQERRLNLDQLGGRMLKLRPLGPKNNEVVPGVASAFRMSQ